MGDWVCIDESAYYGYIQERSHHLPHCRRREHELPGENKYIKCELPNCKAYTPAKIGDVPGALRNWYVDLTVRNRDGDLFGNVTFKRCPGSDTRKFHSLPSDKGKYIYV